VRPIVDRLDALSRIGTLEEVTKRTADRLLIRLMELGQQAPGLAGQPGLSTATERGSPGRIDDRYRPNAKGTIQEPVLHWAKST
jgi:hypothetical protein